MEIKQVQLKDSVLIEAISALIDTTFVPLKNEPYDFDISPFEQGKGYIKLAIWSNQPGSVLTKYQVTATLNTVEKDHSDSLYPQFFTYIKDSKMIKELAIFGCMSQKWVEETISQIWSIWVEWIFQFVKISDIFLESFDAFFPNPWITFCLSSIEIARYDIF